MRRREENDNAETGSALSDAETIEDRQAQGVSLEAAVADVGAGRADVGYGCAQRDARQFF